MKTLRDIFGASAEELLAHLVDRLFDYGYCVQHNKDLEYVYGIPKDADTTPIMLAAHCDTVHASAPRDFIYVADKDILWSPQGIGADDRAGVFIILRLLEQGYRPHVIFTDGEERGGLGAAVAVKVIEPPNVKYIIQLDRRGNKDAVFYDCANKEFQAYIETFGWLTNDGSFSDISVFCPAWDICGVNLSVGYYREHTLSEVLHVQSMLDTVRVVANMLDAPPTIQYEWIAYSYNTGLYKYSKLWREIVDTPQTWQAGDDTDMLWLYCGECGTDFNAEHWDKGKFMCPYCGCTDQEMFIQMNDDTEDSVDADSDA